MIFGWLLAAFAIFQLTFTAFSVQAATQTITAVHTYVMGDRDSKEDARAFCYMTAKRKVLEEAGSFIQSFSEVKNFELTKDQITSYTAAILGIEVVKEEFGFNNGTTTLTLTVKATMDIAEVRKQLDEIVADKGVQTKMDAQQQQIRKLENQIQTLHEKLSEASGGSKDEVRKDLDTELVAYYRLGAERGEATAQLYMGLMYSKGYGVPQDKVQAVAWYRRAAKQGLAEAQVLLSVMYDEGWGVPQDNVQSLAWIRKAVEQGNAAAQVNLGFKYAEGRGVPQDHVQAVAWFRKAAEQGDVVAQYNLGVWYAKGLVVPQDYKEAVKWYRKAAEQGNAMAQVNLGLMYKTGTGVQQDFSQALMWIRRAVEQDDALAQYNQGVMYAEGAGVPQDFTQAVAWFGKAAEQGHASAQSNLGVRYAQGKGVSRDFVQAYKWLNLAAARGDKGARTGRDLVEKVMTPAQLAEAQRFGREWQTAFEQRQAKK